MFLRKITPAGHIWRFGLALCRTDVASNPSYRVTEHPRIFYNSDASALQIRPLRR